MKTLLITATMVVALAGCSRGAGGPAGVVEEFARKMESGSCSGIGDYLSESSKAMVGTKLEQACTAAAEMRKADPSKAKSISAMNVLETKEEGDRATVRIQTTYSDGTKDGGEPVTLVRENGAWKIDLLATGMNNSGGAGGAGMTPTTPPAMTPPAMTPPAMTPPAMTPAPTTPAPGSSSATPNEGAEGNSAE